MSTYTKIGLAATVLFAIAATAYAAKNIESDSIFVEQAKISMSQALIAAERHVNGKASHADIEKTKAGLAYDIEVVSGSKVFDVRIDADKGTVLSSAEDKSDQDQDDEGDEGDKQD